MPSESATNASRSKDSLSKDSRPKDSRPKDPRSKRAAKKALPLWQEALLLVVSALVLALVVKTFLVQAFYIPSGSMDPTLHGCVGCSDNDRILVQKVSYWTGDVERGDIVVFDDPGGWLAPGAGGQATNGVQEALSLVGLYPTGGHLVKRVIGVGGDQVACCDAQGRITVNGEPVDETYLKARVQPSLSDFDVRVPAGRLWVMGDNRADSSDSRAHLGGPGGGFVPIDDVVGKVWTVVWPTSRLQVVDSAHEVFSDVPSGGAPTGS